jgi:hypothetical protein
MQVLNMIVTSILRARDESRKSISKFGANLIMYLQDIIKKRWEYNRLYKEEMTNTNRKGNKLKA